jgi:FtsH-binding integral membrane protein
MADEQQVEQQQQSATSVPTLAAAVILMVESVPFILNALGNLTEAEIFSKFTQLGSPFEAVSFMARVIGFVTLFVAAYVILVAQRLIRRKPGGREAAITLSVLFIFVTIIGLASASVGDAGDGATIASLVGLAGYVGVVALLTRPSSKEEFHQAERAAVLSSFEKQRLAAEKDRQKRIAKQAKKKARSPQ